MFRKLFFLLYFFPVTAIGQFRITGKVINIIDKKPVPNASIFLSNASAGTKSNDDGIFDISNVRDGHYELVVSIVGYETYRQNVVVNADLSLPPIQIEPKTIALKQVDIHPDPNWERNYNMFRKEFLGSSENAQSCKILNPEVISIEYNETTSELTASSYDFIEIENKALGYKTKYLLSKFTKSYGTFNMGSLYYEGSAFFEDLKGKKSEIKKWQKNRLNTYLGSDMHVRRSVTADRVEAEGFVVRRLIRTPNPEYGHGSTIKYKETLVTTPLNVNDYVRLTDQKGEYALAFKDFLYITYKGKSERALQTSVIDFNEPYIYFDNNGVIINPQSAVFEDSWGKRRVADILPVDYEPK